MKKEIYRSPWFNLDGYIACTAKYSDGTKITVLQHREMMEKHIGKKLEKNIIVHHKNENKSDNRLENFELKEISAHSRLHRSNHKIELIKGHRSISWVAPIYSV